MNRSFRASLGVLVALVASLLPGRARADDLYFADVLNFTDPMGNSVRRLDLSTNEVSTLVQTGMGLRGFDRGEGPERVYWTDADMGAIRRATVKGRAVRTIAPAEFPSALRLHHATDDLYWGDQTAAEIRRSDTNGHHRQLVTGTNFYRGLAIDEAGQKLYWTTSLTSTTGQIMRANLDGSGQEVVVSSPDPFFKPGSIAVDVAGGKVYWTDSVASKVRRANLDGTEIEDLFDSSAIGSPKGIALQLSTGQVYWGQDVESEGFLFGEIWRMKLDGSNQETVASGLGSVNDIIIVPSP